MESQDREPSIDEMFATVPQGPQADPSIDEMFATVPQGPQADPSIDEMFATVPQVPQADPSIDDMFATVPDLAKKRAALQKLTGRNDDKTEELLNQLRAAEAERQEVLGNIAKNEAIEAEVRNLKSRGASPVEIEKFKDEKGYVRRSGTREVFEAISRLGKGETTRQSDIEKAYDPSTGTAAPLKGIEAVVGDISEQGFLKPWTWNFSKWPEGFSDKNARQRVKQELSQPIVDDDGFVNPVAVNQSNLPRTTQNELMAVWAHQRTGIPRELWKRFLARAGGVTEDQGDVEAGLRRAFIQVPDMFFGAASYISTKTSEVDDRLDDLKKGNPNTTIQIQRAPDGKVYANGVPIPDVTGSETEAQLQKMGWEALIDNTKGAIRAQATENWSQLLPMLIPGLGEVGAAGKVGGAALTARGFGRLGATVKGVGRAAELASKPAAIGVQPLTTVANIASPKKYLAWAKSSPRAANMALAIDRALGVTVATPGITAALAPKGFEEQAAAGALALGVPLGSLSVGAPLLRATTGAAVHPQTPQPGSNKSWKKVRVTPDENDLPKYIRKVFVEGVKPKEQSYADFRQNQITLYDFTQKSWDAMDGLMSGRTGPEQVMLFKTAGARDLAVRKMADNLSTVDSRVYLFDANNKPIVDDNGNPQFIVKMGVTPQGRDHARSLNMIIVATDKHIADKKVAIDAGVASADNQRMIEVFEILRRKFKVAIREIPPEVLNDRDKFMTYVRGNVIDLVDSVGRQKGIKENSLKAYADEIQNMLTGSSPDFAYERFISDVMKMWAPLIDAGVSLTPTQKMGELLGFIANPPELGMDYKILQQKADIPPTVVQNLAGERVALEPLSKVATAKQFLEHPGVVRDVIRYSQGVVQQYHGLKGASSLREARESFKVAKAEVEDTLIKRRIQTTLRTEEVARELMHTNSRLEKVMDSFIKEKKVTVRSGGKKVTTTVPALVTRIEGAVSEVKTKLNAKEISIPEANAVARGKHYALKTKEQVPQQDLAMMPAEYRSMFVEANRLNADRARFESRKSIAETQLKMLEEDKQNHRNNVAGTIQGRYELLARGKTGEAYNTQHIVNTVEFFKDVAKKADAYGVFKTKYGDNVLKTTAAKLANSWDGTTFDLRDVDAGFIRLMADEDFARSVMGLDVPSWVDVMNAKTKGKQKYLELKEKRAKWKQAETEIKRLADFVATATRHGEKLKRNVTELDAIIAKGKADLPAANAMLRYMRDTYNISKMSRELVDKRLSKVMELSMQLAEEGKVYRPADVKLMAWMASSNMVNRFRIEHSETPHLITYQAEVDNIFRVMRDTIPEMAKLSIDSVAKTLGIPSDSLNAAVITGYFVNPRNNYDSEGYMRTMLEAARWFKEKSLRGSYSTQEGEVLRGLMLEEVNANLFSRAHALDVDRWVAAKAVGIETAKRVGAEFVRPFHIELEGLEVGGKSYSYYQSRKPFVDVLKKLVYGHAGRTDYLMVPEVTAQGGISHRWTDTGRVLLRWLDDEVQFKKAGAERTPESLRATVNDEMEKAVPKNAKPEEINAIKSKYDRIYESIRTYWNVDEADYDTYKMAFNALRVMHEYDFKRIKKFNELNKDMNKQKGTNYAGLEWFPYRLEAGTQLLSELQVDPDNLSHPSLMTQMFGRSIASSMEGQLAKCQAIPGVDSIMLHPQEAFDVETTRLFQGVYTRDPMRRLYEHAVLLNDAGFNGAARLMTASFIGAEKELRANSQSLVTSVMDKGLSSVMPGGALKFVVKGVGLDVATKYGPRTLGIFLDPRMFLLKPVQAFVENPLQAVVTGVGNNPKNIARTLSAFAHFYPKVVALGMRQVANILANTGRAMVGKERVKLTEKDMMEFISFSRPYSPAYAEARVRLLQGINGVRDPRIEQARKRINWEVNRGMKGVDRVVGDRVAGFYDRVSAMTKELSEFVIADISIGQAMNIWENALEKVRGMDGQSFEARARAAYEVLHINYEGTFGNEVAAWAVAQDLVRGVDSKTPLAAFEGFAAQYSFGNTGRFDAKNIPKALQSMDKIIPGTSEFFVPRAQGLYRLGLALHGALSKGVNPTHAGVAAMAAAAAFGTAYGLVQLASTSGISWFNRLQNVPGMETMFGEGLAEEAKGLTTPTIRGGRMQHKVWLTALMTAIGSVVRDKKAMTDGTFGSAEHEQAQQEVWMSLVDQFAKLTPAVLMTDIVKSPARYGWLQFFADPEEIQEKVTEIRGRGTYDAEGRVVRPETPDAPRQLTLDALEALAEWGKFTSGKWREDLDVTPEDMRMVLGKYGKLLPESAIQEITEEWKKREAERLKFETKSYLYGDERLDEKTQEE